MRIQTRGTLKYPEETYIEQRNIELMREHAGKREEPFIPLVIPLYFEAWFYREIVI